MKYINCKTPKTKRISHSHGNIQFSKHISLKRRYNSHTIFHTISNSFLELNEPKTIIHDFNQFKFFEEKSYPNSENIKTNLQNFKLKEKLTSNKLIEKKNNYLDNSFDYEDKNKYFLSNFLTYLKEQEIHLERNKEKENQFEKIENLFQINNKEQSPINNNETKIISFYEKIQNNHKMNIESKLNEKKNNKTQKETINENMKKEQPHQHKIETKKMYININNNLNNNNYFNNIYNPIYQNSQIIYSPFSQNHNINYIPYNYINHQQQNNLYFTLQKLHNNHYNNQYQNKSKKFISINKIVNQNYNCLSDEELAQNARIIAKYQSGCRYLQMKIDEHPELVQSLFFPNILCYIQDLSCDQYGIFFIKKIICYLNEEQFLQLFAIILPVVLSIGKNKYGNKILQDLINYLKSDILISAFIKIIYPHIISFINDSYGVFIVEKLLNINSPLIQDIHKKISLNLIEIATNKNGCYFLRKYFETTSNINIESIIVNIEKVLNIIITDQYGNYIIQSILNFKNDYLKEKILNSIILNINFYSKQKFSSNVVEKCLDNDLVKNKIINEIMKEDNFKDLIFDKFGNYVIQKAISSVNDNTRIEMFKILIPLIPKLQKYTFGQKLLSKLILKYPNLSLYVLKFKTY